MGPRSFISGNTATESGSHPEPETTTLAIIHNKNIHLFEVSDLMPPGVPELREAVQKEDERLSFFARLHIVQAHPVHRHVLQASAWARDQINRLPHKTIFA